MILERWKTNKRSPMICLAYWLESVQAPGQGGNSRQSSAISLCWGDGTGGLRKPRQLELPGRRPKGEGSRSLPRGPWSLQLINDQSVPGCQETIWGQGKNHQKGLEETISRPHTRQKEFVFPQGNVENLITVRALVEYTEDCCLNWVG